MELYNGDCLEVMKNIPDNSVDMILADLPYGTTKNDWDSVIPFAPLWAQLKRIIKRGGAVALHADMPFTAKLVCSNLSWYRYELIWEKPQGTDFLNAGRKPIKNHESIQLFSEGQITTYNPQFTYGTPYIQKSKPSSKNYGSASSWVTVSEGGRFPKTVLKVSPDKEKIHPTQKPIELESWLIRTYTNPGEKVLDCCMGSGSTGVACIREGREFIGIEKDAEYFRIAKMRLEQEQAAGQQLSLL